MEITECSLSSTDFDQTFGKCTLALLYQRYESYLDTIADEDSSVLKDEYEDDILSVKDVCSNFSINRFHHDSQIATDDYELLILPSVSIQFA
ncbi:unnamed protein product, partial [Rotaria magnacalcarata]